MSQVQIAIGCELHSNASLPRSQDFCSDLAIGYQAAVTPTIHFRRSKLTTRFAQPTRGRLMSNAVLLRNGQDGAVDEP